MTKSHDVKDRLGSSPNFAFGKIDPSGIKMGSEHSKMLSRIETSLSG